MNIIVACPLSVAAPVFRAAAFCASNTASRRRNASYGVSPGKVSDDRRTGAVFSGSVGGEAAAATAGLVPEGVRIFSSDRLAIIPPDGTSTVGAESTGSRRAFFRLAGVCFSSRLSHNRRVSWPMSIPSWLKPPTSEPTDSPAWRSRSNSSRCGASWATARSRGQRARATASANVGSEAGVIWECAVSDMGVIGERYAQRQGSARGAPRAQSKRKRLDVGVLPHFFVLFLLGEAGSFLGSFIGWFIELVDCLVFVYGVLVELAYLSRWFPGLLGHFSGRIILGSFDPSLVVGGGGC